MASLALQRCLNHESREAVCRCPSCDRFFCRECVAPFESRLLCANCLAASITIESQLASPHFGATGAVLIAAAVLAAWLLFYLAGWTILQFREHAPLAFLAVAALRFSG